MRSWLRKWLRYPRYLDSLHYLEDTNCVSRYLDREYYKDFKNILRHLPSDSGYFWGRAATDGPSWKSGDYLIFRELDSEDFASYRCYLLMHRNTHEYRITQCVAAAAASSFFPCFIDHETLVQYEGIGELVASYTPGTGVWGDIENGSEYFV